MVDAEGWRRAIGAVAWRDLRDARGDARLAADMLPQLLASDRLAREEAWAWMYQSLCLHGAVSSATAASVPLLLELLDFATADTRLRTLRFLRDVAGLTRSEYEELLDEGRDTSDHTVYEEFARGAARYVASLDRGEPDERTLATRLLGSAFAAAPAVVPRLVRLVDEEPDRAVRATALRSRAELGPRRAIDRVRAELGSTDPLLGTCAVLALAHALRDDSPEQVIDRVADAISAPPALFCLYPTTGWAEGELAADAAEACGAIGRRGIDRALPRMIGTLPGLDPGRAVATARYMLALAFGEGEPPFSQAWPDVLHAIADAEPFWAAGDPARELLLDFNLLPRGLQATDERQREALRALATRLVGDPHRDRQMRAFLHRR